MKSYISHQEPSHARVLEAATYYLEVKGFRLAEGVRVRTLRPDIVAVKGDTVVVVEAIGPHSDLRRALAQAALYSTDATCAYLAAPVARIEEKLKMAAKSLGIGLMAVAGRASVVIEPSVRSPRPVFLRRVRKALGTRERMTHDATKRRQPPLHRVIKNKGMMDVLLSDQERRFTIRELSIEAHMPYSTARRAVKDLISLGAVRSERVGPSEYVALNLDSPLLDDLVKLRALNLSPYRAAGREFVKRIAAIPEVRRVVLFGSVARGEETTDSDIDIAVYLSSKKRKPMQRILDAVSEVQDRTRLNIVPLVTSSKSKLRGQLARSIEAGEVLFERHR